MFVWKKVKSFAPIKSRKKPPLKSYTFTLSLVNYTEKYQKFAQTSTSTSTSTTLGNIYANSTVILRPELSTSCSEKKAWIPVFQWAGSAAKYIVLTTKNIQEKQSAGSILP